MAGILRDRPLLQFAFGLILGLSWREYPWNSLLALPLLMLVGDWRKSIPLILALCGGIAFSPSVPSAGLEKAAYLDSVATVVSVPRLYPDRISYVAEVQGRRVAISEPLISNRSMGDRIKVRGLARPLSEGSERGMLAKGIVARMSPIAAERMEEGPAWYRAASEVRKSFVSFSRSVLPPDQAVLLDALCFNVEGSLDSEFEDDLRRTGTIHIISASGLHALILALAIDAALGLLPIPRPARLAILGVLLVFYAAASGLQPAIVRSVVMSMVALSAYLWRRESDILSGLALSALFYLAWEPLGIYNIGFQFSFVTVAAFALFGKYEDQHYGSAISAIRGTLRAAVQTTAIAYVATLPLLALHFGAISLISIPANVVVVPAAMSLVAVGMGSFAVYGVLPGLSEIVAAGFVAPLLSFLETTIRYFGNLSIVPIPGGIFSGYWLLPVYGLMLLWVRERVRPA